MFTKVISAGVMGVDGFLVTVKCDTGPGLNSSGVVGVAETAVRENRAMNRGIPQNPRLTSVTLQGSVVS